MFAVYILYLITSRSEIYLISWHSFHQYRMLSMQPRACTVRSRGSLCQTRPGGCILRKRGPSQGQKTEPMTLLWFISPDQYLLNEIPAFHWVEHGTLSFHHTLVTAYVPSTFGIRCFALLPQDSWLKKSRSSLKETWTNSYANWNSKSP